MRWADRAYFDGNNVDHQQFVASPRWMIQRKERDLFGYIINARLLDILIGYFMIHGDVDRLSFGSLCANV